MASRSLVLFAMVLLLAGCPESNLDPKVRWGSGLKGILTTVNVAAESATTGPLDNFCGATTNMPTNCRAVCPAIDSTTGWYLTARLECANQPPGTPGNGLWEGTCGTFKEGLQAGQDEKRAHFLDFEVTKPSGGSNGSVTMKMDMLGDIFLLPFAIDKVWVNGIYHFTKELVGTTEAFTVADMALECQADSKVMVDMVTMECTKFKTNFYDTATCS
ncbi:MAG: hypothetical protein HYR96_03495 [Deltaproteobacteria bacterium]|nr:hypothetical protein [Deltaproteobacteria bacterium]MBI3295181.1 hypothetical protein [Deltaproteobacteria bacterium]